MTQSRKRLGFVTPPRIWKTLALITDSVLGALAMIIAVWFRYTSEFSPEPPQIALQVAPLFAVACFTAFFLLGVHRSVWRYTGLEELWRILQAIGLANLIFVPTLFFSTRGQQFPRTAILFEMPLYAGFAVGLRIIVSQLATRRGPFIIGPADDCNPVTLLVGSAADAATAITAAHSNIRGGANRTPRIAGIITTDGQHMERAIAGVRVMGGPAQIDDAIEELQHNYGSLPQIAVAGSLTDRKALDIALTASSKVGATIHRFTPGDGSTFLAPVAPADLLTRPPRDISSAKSRALLENKRVLVTGAGGSIGSELCRQIAAAGPAKIILFEASERNLYEIDMELSERFPKLKRVACFGDVRDTKRVEEVFAEHQPEVVMHAAALKHVPLMELNPNEAILTNVCGAKAIADAAAQWGCGAFVFISTDKAVNPSNVMGATKRAGEIYVRAMAEAFPKVGWAAVRFGNVLGSAGSVLPLFERQITAGGPVTVTDPEITRYFMTVEEASRLVIAAAAHAHATMALNGNGAGHNSAQGLHGGEVYVLDMGTPVKIVDLANALIRLKGLEPNQDIKIEFTGLRPGEKLHEEIFYSAESVRDSGVNGIMIAAAKGRAKAELDVLVLECSEAAKARKTADALEILKAIVSEPA